MIIDHIARMSVGTSVNDPASVDLLRLLEEDNIWLKLSGPYYTSILSKPFADVVARVRGLGDQLAASPKYHEKQARRGGLFRPSA